MKGKMKIKGNMQAAMKFIEFKEYKYWDQSTRKVDSTAQAGVANKYHTERMDKGKQIIVPTTLQEHMRMMLKVETLRFRCQSSSTILIIFFHFGFRFPSTLLKQNGK